MTFLRAIERVAPEVLGALRAVARGDAHALLAWAGRFRLDAPWTLDAARATLATGPGPVLRPRHDQGRPRGRDPIAAELAPYLRAAIDASPSGLVFPGADGGMMSEQSRLHGVLRRALGRAGIVLGYRHVCRARVNGEGRRDRTAPRCAHAAVASDRGLRRCPVHGDALWPVAQVRPIRFHDLRHTTAASLLMMAGSNPAAAQRILRHSDPRITTEVYGHLAPGYLRAEVDRLAFGLPQVAPAA